MRYLLLLSVAIIGVLSCRVNAGKRIKGNGNIATESREVGEFTRIKIRGGINVELVPSGNTSISVEADQNLLPYIITRKEDGWLVLKTRDKVNLRSRNPIRVYISADKIEAVNIAGSGNIKGLGKFEGASRLDVQIAGSGNVDLQVNTPRVYVDIAGSGNVTLAGETKDARVNIAGSGSYEANDLLTETTDVDITGSGDARVHADVSLKADVIGSGNVFYRGKASISSSATGSGRIKRIE